MTTTSTNTTAEETLIERYVEAYNSHDLDAMMSYFHASATVVGFDGERAEGSEQIRRFYAAQFSATPDAHCEIKSVVGHNGRGAAETLFTGTLGGNAVVGAGPEMFEFTGGKISGIRDYHRPV